MVIVEIERSAEEVIGLTPGATVTIYEPGREYHGAWGWVVAGGEFVTVRLRREGMPVVRFWRGSVLPVRGAA